MSDDFANAILHQFTPLLHHVLASFHIPPHHSDYDDFLQELRLRALKVAQDYDGDCLNEDRYRFTNYLKQALSWYCLDLLRRLPESTSSLESLHYIQDETLSQNSLAVKTFLDQAQDLLTPTEYHTLVHLHAGHSLSSLAEQDGVTRQAVHCRVVRIREKLQDLSDILRP
ncbi:sigma-70 family RNA polymerase sigma factor [Aerococcus sanguinicola]